MSSIGVLADLQLQYGEWMFAAGETWRFGTPQVGNNPAPKKSDRRRGGRSADGGGCSRTRISEEAGFGDGTDLADMATSPLIPVSDHGAQKGA